MSDIVAELKAGADDFCADGPCWPGDVVIEAAMEIERLRAENSEKGTMLFNQAKTIKQMQVENEALREALKPFADMCDEIESCAAEYPADHPASDPNEWFTGCVEWPAWRRAKALYEGVIK